MPRGVRAAAADAQRAARAAPHTASTNHTDSRAGTRQLWRAMYVCPYHCTPAGGSDPWIPVIAYLQHRTASSDYDLLQTIRWGEDSTEAGGAAGGSSSSRGSRAAAGHSYGSAVQLSSVPASSALRLALLCAALGRVTKPTLGMARPWEQLGSSFCSWTAM